MNAARGSILTILSAAILASPLHAQWERYARGAVLERSPAPVVVIGLRIPVGSTHDPAGLDGAAALLAHTLVAQGKQALALSAGLEVTVGRSSTLFTASAPQDEWEHALEVLDRVVFRDPLDPLLLERNRSEVLGRLTFAGTSPVAEFDRLAAGQLATGDAWAHPVIGSITGMNAIEASDLNRLRQEQYDPGRSTLAVIGAPAGGEALATTTPVVGEAPVTHLAPSEGRTVATREVTSTWLSIVVSLPSEIDRTLQEFIAALVEESLGPSNSDPFRYALEVRLSDTPSGPTVVVTATVAPDAATSVEADITRAISELRTSPPRGEFFTWARRRFRTKRLLSDADPFQAAARVTADLMRSGVPRNLQGDVWVLSPVAVAEALRSLGTTRVFVLGPNLGGGG